MNLLQRISAATKAFRGGPPTEKWYEPDVSDRHLVHVGFTFDKALLRAFLLQAHQGETQRLSAFKHEMRAQDTHLDAEIRKAEAYLTQNPLEVMPYPQKLEKGSRDAQTAADVATYVREQLLDPDVRIDDALRGLFWGELDGVSGIAPLVRPPGRGVRKEKLLELGIIPSERFRYLPGSTVLGVQPGEDQGEIVPIADFGDSLFVHMSEPGAVSPARWGILRRLLTPWIVKRYGIEGWARLAELFGIPFRKGKYPAGNEQARLRLETSMASAGSAGYAAYPDGTDIDFVNAITGSTKAIQEDLVGYCDRAESKAVLGSTQTSDVQVGAGSKASAGVHLQVVETFVTAYAEKMCASLRAGYVKQAVVRNFGFDVAERFTPLLAIRVKSYADLGAFFDALGKAKSAGFSEVPVAWVHTQTGIPVPDEGEPVLKAPAPPPQLLPGAAPPEDPEDANEPPERPNEPPDPEDAAEPPEPPGGATSARVRAAAARFAASLPPDVLRRLEEAAARRARGAGDPIVAPYVHLIRQAKEEGLDLGHLAARVRILAQGAGVAPAETTDHIAAVLAQAMLTGYAEGK